MGFLQPPTRCRPHRRVTDHRIPDNAVTFAQRPPYGRNSVASIPRSPVASQM